MCSGGKVSACPERSTSPAGAKNESECTCSPGYFEPQGNPRTLGPDCVTCPADYYCPGVSGCVAVCLSLCVCAGLCELTWVGEWLERLADMCE